ncbi:unnamed protein product [Parajaminaea phylloscopi]
MIARRPEGDCIATHHVQIDTSVDDALTELQRIETEFYHSRRVYKITLLGFGDEVVELLDWLADSRRKLVLPHWLLQEAPHGIDEGQAAPHVSQQQPSVKPSQSRLPIRVLSLSNHGVGSASFEAIARLLNSHATLATIELNVGLKPPPSIPAMRSLSRAISYSLLRSLILTSTPLSVQGFCALLDGLQAPCLRELRLSLTLPREEHALFNKADSLDAAISVARLIRPKRDEGGQAGSTLNAEAPSRLGGFAPQLDHLSLNGNCLTFRGVRMIVAAAVGGPTWPANTSLSQLEIFAATEAGKLDADDTGSENDSAGMSDAKGDCPGPDDPRSYSHITAENWRAKMGVHLWRNVQERLAVAQAAVEVLGPVRVLGCRTRLCTTASKRKSLLQDFTNLAPELWLRVVQHLDSGAALSARQLRDVVSWACDPTTIGYGESWWVPPWSAQHGRKGHRWPSSEVPPQPNSAAVEDKGNSSVCDSLLPVNPWNWSHTFLYRSRPRDWIAEAWDESNVAPWNGSSSHVGGWPGGAGDDIGGGGGPDGQGGATEGSGHGRRRRRCMGAVVGGAGQTGRFPAPAALAFLEATSTRVPDHA